MENSKKLFYALSAALLAVMVLVLFGRAMAPGKVLFGSDMFTIYLPFKIFARQALMDYGQLPLWMPHLFFGVPLLASSSLLYFYPTDLISMLLPVAPQYTYLPDMILHMLLAFLGTYLYLRQTGIRREAALFSGTAFMISGFMISYIFVGHWNNIKAGALIPLIFYFTEKGIAEKKLLHLLNAGIFLAFQVLATGMQIMAYTLLGTGILALYRAWQVRAEKGSMAKVVMFFAASVAASALFSALQLLPSLPYTDFSWRGNFSYNDFISWSIHPLETLSFILPQAFGLSDRTYFGGMPFNLTTYYFGIIPLLLVPFAFAGRAKKEALFLGAVSILFLVLAFGGFTPLYKLFYYVPVFRQFRNPSRFLYVMTFFIAVLSGMGLHNVMEAAGKNDAGFRKVLKGVTAAAGVLAALFLAMAAGPVTGFIAGLYRAVKGAAIPAEISAKVVPMAVSDMAAFAAVFAAFITVLWLMAAGKLKSALAAALLLAAVNFADVHRIDKKFVVADDYAKYIPAKDPVADAIRADSDICRAADFSFTWGANRNVYYNVEGVRGTHGLIPADYMALEQSGLFNMLAADRYFNIKYFIFPVDTGIPGLEKVYDGANIKVYRDPAAQARFTFKDKGVTARDKAHALELMKSGTVNLYTTAISTEEIPLPASGDELSYRVGVVSYTPNRIKLKVEAGKPGVFILKDLYYPAWKVKVDNVPQKIYNVDYAFMGTVLNKGPHEVEFYYSGAAVAWGAVLTLLGIFGYIAILLRDRRQKTGDRSRPRKKQG